MTVEQINVFLISEDNSLFYQNLNFIKVTEINQSSLSDIVHVFT